MRGAGLAATLFSACLAGGEPAEAARRPNILFIAIDDLNNELGCYGASYVKSPNLDRFARSGVLFERAYCQLAMCAPSRASVLTGARPASTKVSGLYDNFRDALPNIQTLPELFKNHGYFADRIGKVFHLDDVQSWSKSYSAPRFGPQGPERRTPYFNQAINEKGWKKFDLAKAKGLIGAALERSQRGPLTEIADCEDDELLDGKIAKEAVERLRELQEKGQPFFLAVGFHKPHLPFSAPRKYWDLYDRASLPIAKNVHPPENAPYAVGNSVEFMTYTDVPKERPIPEDFARLARHGYYACISFTDAQVGRVLDELDRLGLKDNTIVVLWSDHGFKLGEHGSWGKATNFEWDARVPLIVRAPGFKKNVRASGIVELVDLYPTLAELAGLPRPAHLEGSSFVPVLEKPDRIWKHAAFTEHARGNRMGHSIRTTLHRLVRWAKDGEPDSFELYYYAMDRRENVNLAGKPEFAAMQRDVLARLNAGWSSSASRPPNYDESKVPPYTLPDPLVLNDGTAVRDAATWQQKRRQELLDLFSEHVYGRTPAGRPPEMHWAVTSEDRAALNGQAVRREITIWFTRQKNGPSLNVLVYQPPGTPPAGGWPLFLGLNNSGNLAVHADPGVSMSRAWMRDNKPARNIAGNRATDATRGVQASRWQIERVVARGYATVTAYCGDLCPDHSEGFTESVGAMFDPPRAERRGDQWGAIGIWAWGLSRMMDFVTADPELDGARVALHGQSRLAKTSLWAGAQDERFAIVISNCSSPGGAPLGRRKFGETIAHLNFRFPHWYAENFRQYNDHESALPVDQHQVLALIAPRPLYLGTAEDDEWGDPRGEFVSLKAAEPVYRLFGDTGLPASEMPRVDRPVQGERLAFHIRTGKHEMTAYDWAQYLDFADRIFKTGRTN
jgi:arylsulfatase A-like enzyme